MLFLLLLLSIIFPEAVSQQSGFRAFKFQQNDYSLSFERIEMVRHNRRLVHHVSCVTFKYNRTCAAMNLTFEFKVDVGNDMQVVAQTYKFLSNEYRIFPLRFQINACDALAEDAMGVGKLSNCGNFTGCPFKKNVLEHICNWTVDGSKFPPLIPNGQYMVELQGLLREEDLGMVRIYTTITRAIPGPKM